MGVIAVFLQESGTPALEPAHVHCQQQTRLCKLIPLPKAAPILGFRPRRTVSTWSARANFPGCFTFQRMYLDFGDAGDDLSRTSRAHDTTGTREEEKQRHRGRVVRSPAWPGSRLLPVAPLDVLG